MSQKIVIFIILVSAIFIIPIWAIQTNPNIPTVNSVSAADDGDTSWGGGSECEGYSGPPCTNPQVTERCYPYTSHPDPTCPSPGRYCEVDCDQGSTGNICLPMPAPPSPATGSPTVRTQPNCNSVLIQWSGFDNITGCVAITGFKIYRAEINILTGLPGNYELIATVGYTSVFVDSTTDPSKKVIAGKSYQYRIEPIMGTASINNPVCPTNEPKESSVVAIPSCPSSEPISSTIPTASTPTTPTATTASTSTTSTQRGRYVCRTYNSPSTNGGSQLQLQTIKRAYEN